ncbi:MAG: bifunctional phosphopantothenoylcysteine decarboxylase/phosphopantothenate--cysteine ligase CoaBC [Thermoplasmataceae archaeon]
MELNEFRPLDGKRVVMGITASISLYRSPDVVRELRREGAEVIVAMSREAAELLNPSVLEWASENKVITEITGRIEHINLFFGRQQNTVYLVSPASYNVIGKMANGISDDVPSLLFSFALGHGIKTLISPAMHEDMLTNPVNQKNLDYLEYLGVEVIPPRRADYKAKLAETVTISDFVNRAFRPKLLGGKNILIVSGRGEEPIDPVRTISNRSTGETGYTLARTAYRMGASVSFVGNSSEMLPDYIDFHEAHSMDEFIRETLKLTNKNLDAIIVPAALPDFSPVQAKERKISDAENLKLELKKTPKLINELRKKYDGLIVAFRLSHKDDTSVHFSESKPDIVVYNPIPDGHSAIERTRFSYTINYGDGKINLNDVSKNDLAYNLLKIVSEKATAVK